MATPEIDELDSTSLLLTLELVHKYTGITMTENKKTLLQGRLRRRIKELSFDSYRQYLEYLQSHLDEVQPFINLVTTNETTFFRTSRVWEFFNKEFLPEWFNNNRTKTLKVWSAASSTGEEVYSIGICCQEFKNKNPSFSFQITATDIDTQVLSVAEKGEYQGKSVDSFKNEQRNLFEKYMITSLNGFRIHEELRSKVKFAPHNLFQKPSFRHYYDIIFLRNVLIYFEPQDQEKVLANVNLALADTGFLVIGESESLTRLKTDFKYKAPLIYTRAGG